MGFITIITFCIGASVAEADTLNDCGWTIFSNITHETEAECNEFRLTALSDPIYISRVRDIIRSHPEFDGEWDIASQCMPEDDVPAFRDYIMRSMDTAI